MKKLLKRIGGFLIVILLCSVQVEAAEVDASGEDYLEGWYDELDFSEVDELLCNELSECGCEPVQFSDVVDMLLAEGLWEADYTLILSWLKDTLFYEIDTNRKILLEVVVLAVAFSVLKNFSGAFKQAYISEVSFLLVYGILAVLLLQSFSVYADITEGALTASIEFMRTLVPTFCISMVFSAGVGTSAGFYQIAFLVIFLIQWLFFKILMPLIHGYVLLELFHHFFEEDKFENLTEFLKGIVNLTLKCAGILVVGLNVVQGLMAPAKDRLASGSLQKAVTFIPGVGSVMSGVGELLLGSGILIKNCVGVAALLFLVALGMIPVIKIFCLSFFYKIAAAVVEPVADKRIVGCLKGMAEGGLLYLKLVIYGMALFMVTIALATAASGLAV